jgi:DNA-binding CsgD family transcriptional regulator
LGKSKLDGKESEIKDLLAKGVTKANIAKILGVSWPTLQNFIKTRKLPV